MYVRMHLPMYVRMCACIFTHTPMHTQTRPCTHPTHTGTRIHANTHTHTRTHTHTPLEDVSEETHHLFAILRRHLPLKAVHLVHVDLTYIIMHIGVITSDMWAHKRSHTLAHARTRPHTLVHPRTCLHTPAHTRTCSQMLARAHTHAGQVPSHGCHD